MKGNKNMKIKLKKEMSYEEIEEVISDEEYEGNDKSVNLSIDKVRYFLENYDKLTNKDYYKMICNFYDIRLEDSDYIDYINYKTGNKFDRIIKLETDIINKDIESEGHGRDFSWWTVSYRLCLNVAVNCELENSDKYFTMDEIKELIKDNKIYPINCFGEKCDDRLYANRVKNDIDYLIKFEYGRKNGQLSINDEYFDYFIDKIISMIDVKEIFAGIRSFIISCRTNLECYLNDYYFSENKETKRKLSEVNKLIDYFNEKISILSNDQEDNNLNLISKDPIEMVMKYLKSLFNTDKSQWYKDIRIEQVVQILEDIESDENKELCEEIKKIIIELGDPELCCMMASSGFIREWIDFDKMLEIIIDSEDEWVCYDVIEDFNLDDTTRRRFIQVIIDSGNAELNYKIAKMDLPGIDIKEHGRVVIESKSVWYNFLFAQLEGADVRAHGEVIIESGDTYYNSVFPCYVQGADKERHREVVRIKTLEEESQNSLKKARIKK